MELECGFENEEERKLMPIGHKVKEQEGQEQRDYRAMNGLGKMGGELWVKL